MGGGTSGRTILEGLEVDAGESAAVEVCLRTEEEMDLDVEDVGYLELRSGVCVDLDVLVPNVLVGMLDWMLFLRIPLAWDEEDGPLGMCRRAWRTERCKEQTANGFLVFIAKTPRMVS